MIFDIHEQWHDISVTCGYTLVSVQGTVPLAKLFDVLASNGINVDLILHDGFDVLTLSVEGDADVAACLRQAFPSLPFSVQGGYHKLAFVGNNMTVGSETAARIFDTFAKFGLNPNLVTTSETGIACLLNETQFDRALTVLKEVFGIKIEKIT